MIVNASDMCRVAGGRTGYSEQVAQQGAKNGLATAKMHLERSYEAPTLLFSRRCRGRYNRENEWGRPGRARRQEQEQSTTKV